MVPMPGTAAGGATPRPRGGATDGAHGNADGNTHGSAQGSWPGRLHDRLHGRLHDRARQATAADAAGQRHSPLAAAGWWLFAAALALGMVLSAPALLALGIPYDAPWGPAPAKLHPGSYLLCLAFACLLLHHGNPLAVALHAARRQPLVATYLACMVLVFAWAVFRHGSSGAAYIVQTLWMPGLALICMDLLPPPRRRQVLRLVLVLLCANAVLALAEYAFRFHLVPLAPTQLGAPFFRATALLGHPLLNANVTMALLPAVLLLPWRPWLRIASGLLLLASVLAFGGRTALLVGVAVYGCHALAHAGLQAVRGRYSYLQLTGGAAALLAGGATLVLLVGITGLGERIFSNLTWDNSANVRLQAWDAFNHLRGDQFWLGVAPAQIDRIAQAMGLDPRYEAIENFWIYAWLQFGALGFVPFAGGMACLIVLLWRAATPALRGALLVFFLIASTTNALSSKTVSLTLLAVVVLAAAAVRRTPGLGRGRGTARRAAGTPDHRPVSHRRQHARGGEST